MAPPPFFQPGLALPILWEDRHFVVINKPAGLAAHPGPQTKDSVETRLVPQKRGGPWLVHRLDADTAGCLLLARRKSALIAAQRAFSEHKTIKQYWALVSGRPKQMSGTLTTELRRVSSAQQGWKMTSSSVNDTASSSRSARESRPARTSWRVLAANEITSLLELTLHTGRTHQARVHCAVLGTPIIGDTLYGGRQDKNGLHLLARSLDVPIQYSLNEPGKPSQQKNDLFHIQATAKHAELEAFLQSHALPSSP
ncbi:RluA family pseudouridine synthase [Bombella sp. TMW 2.2543]|uniref:RluA family pseudouridine synthase n=1 Tax=Bombella pluederhausensis TaxID=2967336 RepID=A0ABT3WDA3_9PROT|nr:RluA family pseudouridine synthase [Bombella pluederhausensis]MCX5617065.1 RluA family pseudouridine synthase [Bombella pluederhausensis]